MENNNINNVSTYDRYFNGLIKFGVCEEGVNLLKERYGEQIRKASICTKRESGCAYEGSLLDVALKSATMACNINNMLSKEARVDTKTLCKVCFLNLIGMAEALIPQNDKWRVDHLGEMFTYKNDIASISNSLRSISMCSQCGIGFTPEEIEAMVTLDRPVDDKQGKFYSSLLTTIVKSAYEITFAELKAKAKKGEVK